MSPASASSSLSTNVQQEPTGNEWQYLSSVVDDILTNPQTKPSSVRFEVRPQGKNEAITPESRTRPQQFKLQASPMSDVVFFYGNVACDVASVWSSLRSLGTKLLKYRAFRKSDINDPRFVEHVKTKVSSMGVRRVWLVTGPVTADDMAPIATFLGQLRAELAHALRVAHIELRRGARAEQTEVFGLANCRWSIASLHEGGSGGTSGSDASRASSRKNRTSAPAKPFVPILQRPINTPLALRRK